MLKIVILDAKTLGNDISLEGFNEFGEVSIYDFTKKEEVIDRIKDKDIIITNKVVLSKDNLKYAKNLKLICIAATGTNNVDLNYTNENNIVVTNVAGYSTNSVVQHTFACLFYLLENLKYYHDYTKKYLYCESDTFTHFERPFWEICDKTWGIIGLGEIGKGVAKLAKNFGCNVVYYSTSGKNNNSIYKRCDLQELLKISDIVSIHCPLNLKTENLIAFNELKLMKESSILINVGRGRIVNEKDLAKALDENCIRGAALDVMKEEPIKKDNPLLHIKNKDRLLITPHIAWASFEARKKLIDEIIFNIQGFLNNERRNVIV
ncbi:2-hydroxyacid dehydrogenase [Clostridium botulinum]|uniref:2-hydroxyacid dehydrogenase n=1 Tax=Clostridium botulinum TaxID=1491 RepID=A0A9Q1UXK1_CLOBO|nr:D-2-hydroxyacid dehydrogenase [Clostridium botulinum]AEB74787.1 D-isomer specific 2-hydroxyacid dehydrogenase [Clostridium botulinum BKT015925]KEI01385.1 2-hydroxyacid dehydrogenase [Clostridium botulinum C/D str. Sp77]KEI02816.1 2-hydroxyacid dehydrogenase [Clostridium botulinum D str. 16868]KOA72862.1 2-hydroxyacid dehydrogenase [Clostridium botulinum]KOA82114.1 2-hydroxyacid dehydrogenase [Clostridium botulinum]